MAKTSDSRVQFQKGHNGEDRVVIHPFRWGLLLVVPLGGMLTVWVCGLVSLLGGHFFPATRLSVGLFILFWLCFWLAFGLLLVVLAWSVVFVTFGTEEIRISDEEMIRTRAMFGFRHTQHFPTHSVTGIGLSRPRRRGGGEARRVQMQMGERRLHLGVGILGAEAESLALELNRLLQSHRSSHSGDHPDPPQSAGG